jgi:hypothetical protein
MILKKLSVVAFLGVALVMATGCKSQCETMCEDSLSCDDDLYVMAQDEDDCGDECEEIEELVDGASCDEEWDSVLECMKDADICDDGDREDCSDEYTDFADCINEYCTDDGLPLDPEDVPGECD